MDVTFANPGLLWFLPLAAGPLLIHLFARRRPLREDFPTLRFLSALHQDSRRVSRPRNILLLILRTLFILALLLAFARPLLFEGGMAAQRSKPRRVIILVDASLSTMSVAGGVSSSAEARSRASEIVDSLRPRDRANIIFVGRKPRPVFPELSDNSAALAKNLGAAEPAYERDNFLPSLRLASAQLGAANEPVGEVSRELYIVSDFQKTRWQSFSLPPMPEGTQFFCIPIGQAGDGESRENIALGKISLSQAEPVAGESLKVMVEVFNYGTETFRTPALKLQVGESELISPVQVEPWSQASAIYEVTFPEAGKVSLQASLGEVENDSLPIDNHSYAAVNVMPGVTVDIHPEDAGVAEIFSRALDPFGRKDERVLLRPVSSPAPGPTGKASLLVLCGTGGELTTEARSFVAAGGMLLWVLPHLDTESASLPGGWRLGKTVTGDAWRMSAANAEAPLLAIFEHGSSGDLSRPIFNRIRPLEGGEGSVILNLGGKPALVRVLLGRGTVLLWSLPVTESDFPRRSIFLPLVQEILRSSRRLSGRETVEAGMPLTMNISQVIEPGSITLLGPDENQLPCKLRAGSEGLLLDVDELHLPGIYRAIYGDDILAMAAVNTNIGESNLTPLPGEKLSLLSGEELHLSGENSLTSLGQGEEAWPRLMVYALLAIMAEVLVLFLWNPAIASKGDGRGAYVS